MANDIKQLEQRIQDFSKLQHEMDIGRRYFLQENDILQREKYKVAAKEVKGETRYYNVADTSRANHKLPSGFAKLQIMQKVNYSINDNLTVTEGEDLYDIIIPDWKKKLKQTALMASQTIYEAWQPYVENNELKFKRIPGDQLIVEFESQVRETEKRVTRYYTVDGIEKAEVWTSESVKRYIKQKDKWEFVEETGHITKQLTDSNGEVISQTSQSYGFIPLVILYNNDELKTDVDPIKAFIDVYDITNSDFANNIDDFQEILMVIKGYSGSNPAAVLNKIKEMGGVNVDGDGDVKYEQATIPTEARKVALEQLRQDAFEAGMAVDSQMMATGNVTNNTIAAMYENLNMKANQFEQELQDFWRKLNRVINRYFELTGSSVRVEGELVFDRTMLVNQKEKAEQDKLEIETVGLLNGIVDGETLAEIVSNLDFINKYSEVTKEELMNRLESERSAFNIPDEPLSK